MPSELRIASHNLLKEKKLTIAFAESATGGRLSGEFSLISERGDTLKVCIVCDEPALSRTF